ncbi:serine/threonine protein kinase [Caenimonas koreensis]|uniref:serine/threonine protein kinase n=1 Tax=Caenimonas koreensis TaxID=367474 RepID=UPI003784DEC3
MKLLEDGAELDGFVVRECLHAGGMAHIYRVDYANGRQAPFPMAMKVPRMADGDGAENIVSFEVELQLLPVLRGAHIPRFVAAGDMGVVPYIVMEYFDGRTLQAIIDQDLPLTPDQLRTLGAALASAVHALHLQNACHLDLKPANVIMQPDGNAVLIDFGLAWHALYPDLLAEELRKAVGSPAWIAPEQVVGVRGDPRSDVFAIGVILYELATGRLPFGAPETQGGLRQRLWADPVPPRARRPDLPTWLQEVILRCLQPEAAKRYSSAAHVAFDLQHPDQVSITALGERTRPTSFGEHMKRWFKAAGMQYQPSPLPAREVEEVPIVMVAVPSRGATDATLYSLRQAVQRSLGTRSGARLACVTVIDAPVTGPGSSETEQHRQASGALQQWARGLDLDGHQASFHVIESGDVAQALLRYAEGNHVSLIVMGAATHGLQLQRFVATVPVKVAMAAPCTVILVKQSLPFERLATT